jgi:hypothetical protein
MRKVVYLIESLTKQALFLHGKTLTPLNTWLTVNRERSRLCLTAISLIAKLITTIDLAYQQLNFSKRLNHSRLNATNVEVNWKVFNS